ncbi:DUF3592 domain-containing protein [Actinomadura livida]|uniref:DUF3592 domain-containing protein n=1 Tax=Actinomadura livida TaxID=79909 RepID=A0A7W7I8Q4_9ACTN|nr:MULTISPECIES: DUF3592 domain-containing protein [Actinomadura]MBB4772278.1 hypothetical protein [Actinomadura catellatispora]GGU28171.1 hypothetical protein GCM10010208_61330 [Actinomadura livida]
MNENGRGLLGAIARRHARRQAADLDAARTYVPSRERALRGWPAVRVLLTVLLLAAVAFTLASAGIAWHEAAALRGERMLAAGRVEKAVEVKSGDYANVRFTARDGRAVSAKVTAWKDLPEEGDRVTVCYTPRDPEAHVQDARVCPDFATPRSFALTAAAALVLTAVLWLPWLVRRVLRRRSAITDAGGG